MLHARNVGDYERCGRAPPQALRGEGPPLAPPAWIALHTLSDESMVSQSLSGPAASRRCVRL